MQSVKVNLGRDHNVNLSGDWHMGTSLQDRGAIDATIDDTLSSGSYFVGMGDLVEAITTDDKRYQQELHGKTVVEQYQEVSKMIEMVKDQTILHLIGNHDWSLCRKYGNQIQAICDDLGLRFGDYTSVIHVYADPDRPISPKDNEALDDKYFLYKMYVTHGFGSISSRIDSTSERVHSMNRALRRKLFLKMGDCLIMAMGHTHRLVVIPPVSSLDLYISPSDPKGHQIHSHYTGLAPSENGHIPPEGRWFVNTGGYLRMFGEGVTGYAEVHGYDPLEIGFPKIVCREGRIAGIKRMVLG